MLTISTTYLPSIHTHQNRWLTSLKIALVATLAGNPLAISALAKDLAISQSRVNVDSVANGVHLYGESLRPNVIGKEYIIFEKNGSKAIGAFYLPRSEFSCFYGQFKDARLNVTLFDPFDHRKYTFFLVLAADGLTASKQPMLGQPTYQPLSKISTNDRRILAACKQQLQKSKNQNDKRVKV
jgi:hypothetical protein